MISQKKKQRGAFLLARWVLLMLILVAMLVIPIWLKRNSDDKQKALANAEAVINRKAESSTDAVTDAPAATAPIQADRPIGFGLTFAAVTPTSPQPDATAMGCHGQPGPTDKPHKNSCNPYEGDTSCRAALPVLCLNSSAIAKPDAANGGPPVGWTAATLGATAPVMGAILQSRPIADARCEKELGAGWRMADFHAGGGWSFSGRPGSGLLPDNSTRYWVAINDQAANCWDSKP